MQCSLPLYVAVGSALRNPCHWAVTMPQSPWEFLMTIALSPYFRFNVTQFFSPPMTLKNRVKHGYVMTWIYPFRTTGTLWGKNLGQQICLKQKPVIWSLLFYLMLAWATRCKQPPWRSCDVTVMPRAKILRRVKSLSCMKTLEFWDYFYSISSCCGKLLLVRQNGHQAITNI